MDNKHQDLKERLIALSKHCASLPNLTDKTSSELVEWAIDMIDTQEELEPELKRLYEENKWDLYECGD